MEVDLTKYDADNPLKLEKELSPIDQVKMFNDCYFGEQEMHDDYQLKFCINKNDLKLLNEERNNTFWANAENLSRYFINLVIERGYIPWQLTVISEDDKEIIAQIHCEDRRIEDRQTGLGQP